MTVRSLVALSLGLLLALAIACGDDGSSSPDATPTVAPPTATPVLLPTETPAPFTISSFAFPDNGPLPAIYTCDSRGDNPQLRFGGAPAATAAFALTVVDIDAPGGEFVHWTVWNIDYRTIDIVQRTVPPGGIEGQTSAGAPGYVPPCPPAGEEHRYVFTVYALDRILTLDPATAGLAELQAAMEGRILGQASITARYERIMAQ